jgi:hypothetical protein
MVELGLCAKQEKADRFQHVKKEINEMVKMRVLQLKSKVSYSLYFSLLHTFSNNAENDGYIFG